jgi:phage tail sheath gpL-like
MPMLTTGIWTAATLYKINNVKDAEDGAGPGSMIHRAARVFLEVNKDAKLWALPVAETSGGSPVAATATVTVATTATAAGTATVTICGEDCAFTFKSADTVTTIAAGLVGVINAKTWLPCTANNAAGVITLTAKLKGISQGTATVSVIRLRATISTGVTTTITTSGAFLGSAVAGAEGSTTEAANLATALVTIAATRKYYVVSSSNDSTSWTNIKTHVTTKTEPRRGLRSVGVVAYTGTLAAMTTLATGQNYERTRAAWQKNSDWDCAAIAANYAAVLQKREAVDSAYNFDNYSGPDWLVPPAYSNADWPTSDDLNDAISDGITAIASNDATSYIVMSCATRSKNSTGTVDDFRATQSRVVSVTDEFVDEACINFVLNHGSKKFADDERLADGSINPNQKFLPSVLKPSQTIAELRKQMDEYELAAKIQDADKTKESVRAVKTGGRLETGFDLEVINWLDQMTMRVAEISNA